MFQCTSKLRAADTNTVLNLTTKHRLEYGDSGSSNIANKSRFPANIDIFPASVIVFSFSAVLDRKPLASDVLIKSQLTHHFLEFLQSNADQLGLGTVSALYLDAGCPKIDVSSNRTHLSFHDSVPVRVVLRTIHLQYSVSSKETKSCDGDVNLFSTRLSLPYRSLMDNILKRFVTFHLVKRYPLIFGTVCQQLDLEMPFFPKIFRSVLEMAKQSPNSTFRSKFKQTIKLMKDHHQSAYTSTSAALTTYLNNLAEPDPDNGHDADEVEIPEIQNETALCLSMEKLFSIGMKQPRFKPAPGLFLPMILTDTQDDDELSRDHFATTAAETTTASSGAGSSSGFVLSSSAFTSSVLPHDSDEEADDMNIRMLGDEDEDYFDHLVDMTGMGVGVTMGVDGHLRSTTQNPSQISSLATSSISDIDASNVDDEESHSPASPLPHQRKWRPLFPDTSDTETGPEVAAHSYSPSEMDFELDAGGFSDLDLAQDADDHLAHASYSCVHVNHHPGMFPKPASTPGSPMNAPHASSHSAPFDDLDIDDGPESYHGCGRNLLHMDLSVCDIDVDMDIMCILPDPPPSLDVHPTHIICDLSLDLDEGHDNLNVELDIDSDHSDHGFDLDFDDLHSNEATLVPLPLPQLTQTQTYATETSPALPAPPRTKRGGADDNDGLDLKLFNNDMELLYDDDEEQEQTYSYSGSSISSFSDSASSACNGHSLFSYSSVSPSTSSFYSSSGKPSRLDIPSPLQQQQDQNQWHPLDADDSDDEEESAACAKEAKTDLDLVFFDLGIVPVTPMLKLLETNLGTNPDTDTNRNTNSQSSSKLGSDSKTHLDVSNSDMDYLVRIATTADFLSKPIDGADEDIAMCI